MTHNNNMWYKLHYLRSVTNISDSVLLSVSLSLHDYMFNFSSLHV